MCFEEELKSLAVKNSMSALIKAFTDCYKHYDESKARVKYISDFSRIATLALYEGFRCENIKHLLDKATNYLSYLYKEVEKVFEAVFAIDLRLVSRLAIYTRNPFLPLEISLAWDPVLNLPYIPSSSIKGAVRSWIELYIGKSVNDVSLEEIFGSEPESRGEKLASLVVFTDAYPISCATHLLEPDVLTPHYATTKLAFSEPEASPTPMVFPTIAPNTVLRFIVAFKYKRENKQLLNAKIITKLIDYTIRALEEGLGAKTSIGYGRAKSIIQSRTIKEVTK